MRGSKKQILTRIESLQEIQRRNSPKTKVWQDASRKLQPLFAEMARREPFGTRKNPLRRKRSKMKKAKRIVRTRKRKIVKRKAKPRAIRYKITAQNTGKRMHYDGRNFSERAVKSFLTADAAKTHALMLLRKFPRLRKYQVRIESFR